MKFLYLVVEELDNEDNWNQAEAGVVKTLEQATKVIPVRKIRLNVDHTRKQFLLMAQVMAKRNQVIHEVCVEVVSKLATTILIVTQAREIRVVTSCAWRSIQLDIVCRDNIEGHWLLLYVYFQLDSQAIDLEGELVKAKRQNEELRKNNKKSKVKAEKFQYQCEDLQTKLVSKC